MDAALIVAKLHGDLLRVIAEHENVHFDGLRNAASHLRRRRNIDGKVCKKLVALDETFNLNRHITFVSAKAFLRVVVDQLSCGSNRLVADEFSSGASTSLPHSGYAVEIATSTGVDSPVHTPEFFCLYDSDEAASAPSVAVASTQTAHTDNGVVVLPQPSDLVHAALAQACALLRGDLLAASARIVDRFAVPVGPGGPVTDISDPPTLCPEEIIIEPAPVCSIRTLTTDSNHDFGDLEPAAALAPAGVDSSIFNSDMLNAALHHCDHACDAVDAFSMAVDEFANNQYHCQDLDPDFAVSFTLESPELGFRFAPPAPLASDLDSTTVR